MPTEQKTHAQIYEAAKDELVRDIALLINSEGATGEMLHDMLDATMVLRNLSMRAEKKDIILSSFQPVIESIRDGTDGPIIKF